MLKECRINFWKWYKKDDRLKINKIANNFKLKIEINNKINNIFESLAQTIFKSWFVDFDPVYAKKLAFDSGLSKKQAERVAIAIISGICNPKKFVEDFKKMDHLLSQKLSKMNKKKQKELAYMASLFPGEFEDSDLGEIPKGFNVCRIDQILELAYGKSLKKSNRVEGSYPVYNSEGRSGVHNVYSVKGPGIILGRKGTTDSLYWEDNNFFPVDTTFFIKLRKSYKLTFIFYLMQTLGLEKMNTNALTLNFNRNNVYKLKFVEFPREIRIVL